MSTDMLPVVGAGNGPVASPPFKKGVDLAPKLFVCILLILVVLLSSIGLVLWSQGQGRLRLKELERLSELSVAAEHVQRSFDECTEAADALVITLESTYRIALSECRDRTASGAVALVESSKDWTDLSDRSLALQTKIETQLRDMMAVVADARFMEAEEAARVNAYQAQLDNRLSTRSAIAEFRTAVTNTRSALADSSKTAAQKLVWILLGLVALGILLLAGLTWLLWFGWSNRLARLMNNLARLGRSDQARKAVEGSDELARLDRAIDEIISALLAMREWERAILTNVPVGLFAMKPNGNLTWVSRRTAAELEYDRTDLEGHSIYMLASKQDEGRLREFVETLARGGRMSEWELHLVTRSGRTVMVRLSGTSPQGMDMVCALQNVAERQAAQATSARLTQVTEQMPDPVIEFTDEFEVIYMNQVARERFPDLSRDGRRHAALQGTGALLKLLADGDAPTVSRQFAHMSRAYDQRIVYLASQRAYRAYCHDITSIQKAVEDLRRNRDALERADSARAETLVRVGSDLSTPANALVGFVGLLREDPALIASPSALKSLERMAAHVAQLQGLSKNIDDLQRIDKGEISIVPENINVRWILLDVVAQVAPQTTPRSVRFQGIDSGPDVHVWADRPQLQQALVELFGSLARYSRVGGNVVLNWISTEGVVRLAISAVGASTAMDVLRNGTRSATGAESLGVGFSVARRVIEHMAGRLAVTSQTGTSITLTLELPLGTRTGTVDASAANKEAKPADQAPPENKYTVLYIDDSAVAVELAADMLSVRKDVLLESAGRGDEGIAKARRLKPHLIVLDLHLPDMSGLDVLRLLKTDTTTQSIPVIALTADHSAEDREKGLAAGLQRYLTKPLATASLLEAVTAFLPPK